MTRPRAELVSPAETPYYHCICRCVRRAFLCGEDPLSGVDYSHRKSWVLERLCLLGEVFTIDLCAYAVMANHYHLVVHLDQPAAQALNDTEVTQRWQKLFTLPPLVSRYLTGQTTSAAERQAAQQTIAVWRHRLSDLSWYMRCLNEYIARKANEEDNCKGRFWEGRFKSQAILDEAGLLTCMAYVDLNPLRAGVVELPEDSVDISIYDRLQHYRQPASPAKPTDNTRRPILKPFQEEHADGLPFAFADYLQLVDWAGRVQRDDKAGALPPDAPPILERLGLDTDRFLSVMAPHTLSRGSVIGQASSRQRHAHAIGRRRCQGAALSAPVG